MIDARDMPKSGGVSDEEVASELDALIDQRIEMAAPDIVRKVASNMAPGGLWPLEYTIVSPTASSSVEVGSIPVLAKGFVHAVYLAGDAAGSVTIDVKRARPNETAPSASLFGATLPSLSGARSGFVMPSADWLTYVEPWSSLWFYVTAVSGMARVDIALIMRGIAG